MNIQPMPDMTAEEVRAFRQSVRLTQSNFAALLSVSLSTVEKWEKAGAPAVYRLAFAALNERVTPWGLDAMATIARSTQHAIREGYE